MELTASRTTQMIFTDPNPIKLLNGQSCKIFGIQFVNFNFSNGIVTFKIFAGDGVTSLFDIVTKGGGTHAGALGGNMLLRVPFIADKGLAIATIPSNGFQLVTIFHGNPGA